MALLKNTKNFNELKKKVQERANKSGFGNKNQIKWERGNTYKFRLLFRQEDKNSKWNWHPDLHTDDGFIKRVVHGAKDGAGKYRTCTCPVTFYDSNGYDMCPTCGVLPELYEDDYDTYAKLKRRNNYYAYVYVVNDPVTPANNGHVKEMWMGQSLYADLKAKIWGIDERYKGENEELEEIDPDTVYEAEAFMLEDGFDLIIKVTTKKVKGKNGQKDREYNEYNASFAKDRSSLDVDIKVLEKEIEELGIGKNFKPETEEKLQEFFECCVLGNTPETTTKKAEEAIDEVETETETETETEDEIPDLPSVDETEADEKAAKAAKAKKAKEAKAAKAKEAKEAKIKKAKEAAAEAKRLAEEAEAEAEAEDDIDVDVDIDDIEDMDDILEELGIE